ncbi:MAG TPA: DUF4260 domain-containing protein [Pseudolabrys sp.]|nr:DUF4260 domain-containing protein [Pseudolabrys sp.]
MSDPSSVSGTPRLLLRAEGAAIFIVALVLYMRAGAPWWLFAALFLAPDLSLFGYLAGARAGAVVYNAAHTLIAPLALAAAGLLLPATVLVPLALIWAAHIGFDRLAGYGLKYGAGFGFTHLGRVGRSTEKT